MNWKCHCTGDLLKRSTPTLLPTQNKHTNMHTHVIELLMNAFQQISLLYEILSVDS